MELAAAEMQQNGIPTDDERIHFAQILGASTINRFVNVLMCVDVHVLIDLICLPLLHRYVQSLHSSFRPLRVQCVQVGSIWAISRAASVADTTI